MALRGLLSLKSFLGFGLTEDTPIIQRYRERGD